MWLFPLFVSAGVLVSVLHRGIAIAASHLLLHPDSAAKVGVGLVIGTSAQPYAGHNFRGTKRMKYGCSRSLYPPGR